MIKLTSDRKMQVVAQYDYENHFLILEKTGYNLYQKTVFPYFRSEDLNVLKNEAKKLLLTLPNDRKKLLQRKEMFAIRFYGIGNIETFIKDEEYDYEYAEDILAKIVDSEEDINNIRLRDWLSVLELFLIKKYSLYNFHEGWYIQKYINLQYDFLLHQCPNFAQVLSDRIFMASNKEFTNINLISLSEDISSHKDSIEYLVKNADTQMYYQMNDSYAKTVLAEIDSHMTDMTRIQNDGLLFKNYLYEQTQNNVLIILKLSH